MRWSDAEVAEAVALRDVGVGDVTVAGRAALGIHPDVPEPSPATAPRGTYAEPASPTAPTPPSA